MQKLLYCIFFIYLHYNTLYLSLALSKIIQDARLLIVSTSQTKYIRQKCFYADEKKLKTTRKTKQISGLTNAHVLLKGAYQKRFHCLFGLGWRMPRRPLASGA